MEPYLSYYAATRYEDIADFEEADLDCDSLEYLFEELDS